MYIMFVRLTTRPQVIVHMAMNWRAAEGVLVESVLTVIWFKRHKYCHTHGTRTAFAEALGDHSQKTE